MTCISIMRMDEETNMNGRQHLHTRLNGRMFRRIILLALIVSLLFCGCSSGFRDWMLGPGRDWKIELMNDYYLFEVNSRCKMIVQATQIVGDYAHIIEKFYVTKYQVFDSFVYLCGITTQEEFISEKEKACTQRDYYLLDTESGIVSGPFDSKEGFEDFCISAGVKIPGEWISVP